MRRARRQPVVVEFVTIPKREDVGHFAVGFGAKRFAPKTSLGTLVLSAMLADLLGFAFVAFGIEHIGIQPGITRVNALNLYDFAWSHSLLMDLVWGGLLAGAYFLLRRYIRGAWIIFAAVLSHWVLDWLSHRPDMALAPGIHRYFGLGLYNSPLGLLLVEGGLWVAGIIIYCGRHAQKDLWETWRCGRLSSFSRRSGCSASPALPRPASVSSSWSIFSSSRL